MAEAKKVFPMDTFSAYLKGGAAQTSNKKVKDLLSHMTQKDIDEDFQLFAAAISKAWIYEQHPEMAKMAGHELSQYGESVAVTPLPEDVLELSNAVFARLEEYRQTIAEQTEKIESLEKKVAEDQKTIGGLEGRVKEYDRQNKAGEEKIVASKGKVEEYLGKVDDLLAKIEEVKKHGVVAVSGEGGAAAGAEPEAKEGGEVSEDFGFGTEKSEDDFGF
jgi:uncharacterized coiled-coil protein SlyX